MRTLLVLLLSFGLVLPAAAQVPTTTDRTMRETTKQEIKAIRTETRQEVRDLRDVAQEKVRASREDLKKRIEEKRAGAKEAIETQRTNLKERLKTIKDERKRTTVERINERFTNLNDRITTHYANVLDQIDTVLDRVIAKTDTVEKGGKDVTSVKAAITKAHEAIAAARSALATQAGKTYAIVVEGEETLKNNVREVRDMLHGDLKGVEKMMKDARDAVRVAIVTLAGIQGEKTTATSSASTSTNE